MGWSKGDKRANQPDDRHSGGKKNTDPPIKGGKKNDTPEFEAHPDPYYEDWKKQNKPIDEQ